MFKFSPKVKEIEAIYNDEAKNALGAVDKSFTGIAGNAIKLLGQGLEVSTVARTLGCDDSYISQLLADDEFKKQVTVMKMDLLQAATNRDRRLDDIEDKIITKVEKDLEANPFAFKSTSDAIRHLSIVNGLKRRGAGADLGVLQNQTGVTVVKLTLNKTVVNKFEAQVDINNQVIKVGDQDMITVSSSTLSAAMKGKASDIINTVPGIVNAGKDDRLTIYE